MGFLIVAQIYSLVSFCVQLVVPAGTTSYDVLPSILPLPMFNFYTKMAAVELMVKQSMDDMIDLVECPGCKQAVDINEPNGNMTL
ncbi:hypothetical protein Y032_0757g2101 [Ancylostoma ceylanicum]|uniref:LITAF domain-containing protein n=1 Tax=Ancylostoma ceylanicum TaxID=53326 RepID=A0A016WDK9_9BILA|nr:hypothetical protein Y032_0757g2101 [Ancylostoma ceylanicum]